MVVVGIHSWMGARATYKHIQTEHVATWAVDTAYTREYVCVWVYVCVYMYVYTIIYNACVRLSIYYA